MRPLVVVTCLVIIGGVIYFVYQDRQAKSDAEARAKEQQMYLGCQQTLPGRIGERMKALNQACKEEGYIK